MNPFLFYWIWEIFTSYIFLPQRNFSLFSSLAIAHETNLTLKEGYRVLVPNFHSMPNGLKCPRKASKYGGLRPGSISEEAILTVLKALMKQAGSNSIHLLLGKSWGGAQ